MDRYVERMETQDEPPRRLRHIELLMCLTKIKKWDQKYQIKNTRKEFFLDFRFLLRFLINRDRLAMRASLQMLFACFGLRRLPGSQRNYPNNSNDQLDKIRPFDRKEGRTDGRTERQRPTRGSCTKSHSIQHRRRRRQSK